MRHILPVFMLITLLLAGSLFPVQSATAAPSAPYAVVIAQGLNIRSVPSTDAAIVGALKTGDRVTLLGRSEDGAWLRIESVAGVSGWVYAELVQPSVPLAALSVVSASTQPSTGQGADTAKVAIQAALAERQTDSATIEVAYTNPTNAGTQPSPNADPRAVIPGSDQATTPAATLSADNSGIPLEPICLPNRLRAVSLGGRPQAITAAADRLYVALSDFNTLMVIDTGMDMLLGTSRTTAQRIANVTAAGDSLYIVDAEDHRLIVTTRQGAVRNEIQLPATPGPIGVTDGRVFVLHPQIGAVSIIDLNTNNVLDTVTVGPDPVQIAVISGRAFIVHASGFISIVDAYGRRQEQLHLPLNDVAGMAVNQSEGILYIAGAADQKLVAVDVSTWTLARTWALDTMPSSVAYNEVTDHLFVLDTTSQFLTILSGKAPERIGRLQVNTRPAMDTGNGLVVLDGKLYVAHPSNDYLDVWLDRTCSNEIRALNQSTVDAGYVRTDLAPRQVEARIGILWPHGGADPSQATYANLTATLLREDGASPACGWEPTVTLWAAMGDQPARQVAVGARRLLTEQNVTYPIYDFNDVDVRATYERQIPIHFSVRVDGVATAQNVWTHSATGQYLPTVRPELDGMVARIDGAVDARLWVERTSNGAQVYATILRAGTLLGVAQSAGGPVPQLRWALDNGVTEPELIVGQPETRQEDGFVYTVWRFPGLDPDGLLASASQARFWVEMPDVTVNSSVLAWGADIRTLSARLPVPVVGCRQEVASR